ncbi:DUF3124 domain-containing protein [Crocinitomix algicola]|uniref:DUF3124 domain-containing protein n=1 Tax=Crocinitomix algicola TaxID=1740263 RepID=UPI00082CC0AC|nr:DUF3124 domain-containing protein [Crocinitomix algicola]
MKYQFVNLLVFLALIACVDRDPNKNASGQDQLEVLELDHVLNPAEQKYNEVFYVPIYSDIYVDENNPNNLLSATLSIRNVSLTDTLYITKIDYYDTDGNLVRQFIDKSIALPEVGTVNYVIEREDVSGGAGANFIVEVSSSKNIAVPRIQAVMIGEYSNKGFSFIAEGTPIRPIE